MILDLLANGAPSRIAISVAGGGPAVTYDQLRQQVEALAAQLGQFGLGRGDRIAMALPNGLEVIASFLAAATVGTAAPLNPMTRTGVDRSIVVPSPSAPPWLLPHAQTLPSTLSATVKAPPPEICFTSANPITCTGVERPV